MNKFVEGTINEVKLVREGEKNGKRWKMFEVIINGEKFKTFDEQFARLVDRQGKFYFTEDNYGRTLTRLQRQNSNARLEDKLDYIARRLDEIMLMISEKKSDEIPF